MVKEFLNVLIQQFELFLILALNEGSHIHADLLNSYFIFSHLATSKPILGNYQEESLTQPMLITGFL